MALKHRLTQLGAIAGFGPILLLLTVQVLVGAVVMPTRAFFPVFLQEQLKYTTVFVSTLVAARQVAGILSAVIGGSLADTLGPKRTLLLGLGGYIVASATFFFRSPWIVTLLWCASGLAMSMHTLGGMSYLIAITDKERLGTFSALYSWGMTAGSAVSNPLLGVVLDRQGYSHFGGILIGFMAVAVIVAGALLPNVRKVEPDKVRSLTGTLLEYATIVRRPLVALLGLMRFLPTCYWGMAGVLIPLLIYRLAGNKTSVAIYDMVSQIAASVAQILVGQAVDHWGRKWPQVGTLSLLVIATLGLALFANQLWGVYVFGVLAACAAWSLSTLIPCLVADTTPQEERGRVLGALHVLWNAGMIVGALLGGALVGFSIGLPFAIAALLNVGAIGLSLKFFAVKAAQSQAHGRPVPAVLP